MVLYCYLSFFALVNNLLMNISERYLGAELPYLEDFNFCVVNLEEGFSGAFKFREKVIFTITDFIIKLQDKGRRIFWWHHERCTILESADF